MARCSVCDHPKIDAINTYLLAGDRTKTALAVEFQLSRPALTRHSKSHLADKIARVMMRHEASAVGKALKTDKEFLAAKFHDRLEELWQYSESAIKRAETAVRVVTDRESGELVSVGADVSAIGPLLAQAHKNQELLGKAAGVLTESVQQQPAGGAQISVTVPVMIAGDRVQTGRIRADTGRPAIDAASEVVQDTPPDKPR